MDIFNFLASYPACNNRNTGIKRGLVDLLPGNCMNDIKDEGNYSKLGDEVEPRINYFASPDLVTSREDKIMEMVFVIGISFNNRVELAFVRFILEMAGVEVYVTPADWKLKHKSSGQAIDVKDFKRGLTYKEKQSAELLLKSWMVIEECATFDAVVTKIRGAIARAYEVAYQYVRIPNMEIRHTSNMFKLSDLLCAKLFYFPKNEEPGHRLMTRIRVTSDDVF